MKSTLNSSILALASSVWPTLDPIPTDLRWVDQIMHCFTQNWHLLTCSFSSHWPLHLGWTVRNAFTTRTNAHDLITCTIRQTHNFRSSERWYERSQENGFGQNRRQWSVRCLFGKRFFFIYIEMLTFFTVAPKTLYVSNIVASSRLLQVFIRIKKKIRNEN